MIDSEGGLGGTAGPRAIRDTRLAERALRERWPIPKAMRSPLIERLARIVQDPEASPREATSAAKAILAASRINLETITAAIRADEHATLVSRAAELETRLEQPTARDEHGNPLEP